MTKDKTMTEIQNCKVVIWKYTYTIILPRGIIFWGSSYSKLTLEKVKDAVCKVLAVFEAGKQAQQEIIRECLGIT